MIETPPPAWNYVFYAGYGIQWNYNATYGRIVVSTIEADFDPLVTGTFTVATITFKNIAVPSLPTVVPLDISYEDSGLSDENGNWITPYYVYDGDINVTLEDITGPDIANILRTPVAPNYDQDVVVSANITDNVAVDKALLSYTYDSTWHNVSMNQSDDIFNATIPSQPYGTSVEYKIFANDTNGNWANSSTYSYTVRDFVAPGIVEVQWIPTCPGHYIPSSIARTNEPILVSANITEPIKASGVKKVLFSYRVDSGEWLNSTMTYNATRSLWNFVIAGQPGNNIIEFYIKAYDNAGNMNTSTSYFFTVKKLPIGDMNGDGKTNLSDLIKVAIHFGEGA